MAGARIAHMSTEVARSHRPDLPGRRIRRGRQPLEVRDPATGELVGTTWQAGPAELERATAAAVEGLAALRRLASYERRDALAHVATCIARDTDELAELLTRESGKPIKDARGEVARGALTFRTAAEEALRINGEWLPLDWNAPAGAAAESCAAIRLARWPASARSTSRSTWPRTRWRRRWPPAAASCSSRRPRTR